jgi:hypothetical protein
MQLAQPVLSLTHEETRSSRNNISPRSPLVTIFHQQSFGNRERRQRSVLALHYHTCMQEGKQPGEAVGFSRQPRD